MTSIRNRVPLHRLPVFRVLQAQLLVAVLAAGAGGILSSLVSGYSALLGGLIALLANLYFAAKAFRYSGARSAGAIVRAMWSGEMGKLFLTAALFALVFVGVRPLDAVALFCGYGLTLATGASALLLVKKNSKR